ncbi:hypothetical protein [Rhodoferax sp. GW822-FHT02A01]|uniref:hypothetical protein n=1 Tax=Rhodoferax sp. GW822-FHT02A01 TaxID=3141537 RepID=UPI00315CC3B1
MSNLFDRQVNQLILDMETLQDSAGSNTAALSRARHAVGQELLHGKGMDMTAAALGQIEDEATAQRLLAIVRYCSEHFEVEGGQGEDGQADSRVLSAVVLPLSVRMHSKSKKPFALDRADSQALKELAQNIQDVLKARKVVFDSRFYDHRSLFALPPRDLCGHLIQLAGYSKSQVGGPKFCQLYAQADAPWRQVFLLGVEVADPMRSGRLDDLNIQVHAEVWNDHTSASIEYADAIFLNPDLRAEAEGHGAHYLHRGYAFGVMGLRSLRLKDMLIALRADGAHLQVFINSNGDTVRTMMVAPKLGLELRAPILNSETLWSFQQELERIAHSVLGDFDPLCVAQVGEDEYLTQAKRHGVILMRLSSKPIKRARGQTGT